MKTIKKLDFIFCVIVLALLAGSCKSPRPATKVSPTNVDESPDSLTIAYLNTLQNVEPADTALDHLTLPVNNQNLKATDFIAAERYIQAKLKFHGGEKQLILRPEFKPFLGLSANELALLDFILKLKASATSMCNAYPSFNDGKQPTQTHIAYVWDSKDYTKRSQPDKDCPYLAYGVDCSGFIYQVFKQNGVVFSMNDNNADHERMESYLDGYLKPLHFYAHDLHKITQFSSGDIIYFLNAKKHTASHIGIVLVNDQNGVSFFATRNGTQCLNDVTCCSTNLTSGPQILKIDRIKNDGREWGVVRLSTSP